MQRDSKRGRQDQLASYSMQLRCPTRARTPESSPRSAPGIPATQAACNTRRASPLLYTYPTSGGGGGWKAGPRQRGSWLGCSPRHRKCAALRIGAWRPATTAGSRPRPVPADCQDIEHQAIASPASRSPRRSDQRRHHQQETPWQVDAAAVGASHSNAHGRRTDTANTRTLSTPQPST